MVLKEANFRLKEPWGVEEPGRGKPGSDGSSPVSLSVGNVMAHFHHRVRVGSVCKAAARVAFPPPKVDVTRTEPY